MQMQFAKMQMMMIVSKMWSSEILAAVLRTRLLFEQQYRDLGTRLMILLRTMNSPGLSLIDLPPICDLNLMEDESFCSVVFGYTKLFYFGST